MFSLKHLNLKSLHSFFFASKRAFTLVELIVVISVLAVLATISFSQVGNITKNARDASRTTSISNIKGSLEIFYAQKGRYPFPDNPTTLTWAWNSKLYKGTITTAVLPWLNTDTKDPTTNAPYQYATLSNTHYQIGTNLEGTTSFNQTLTNQVLADSTSTNTIPYIKWNYTFDPSLPSLFPIGTSSGIFSPTTCFILESSTSPNNFSSTASDCTPKSQVSLKDLDASLVWYWDMETKTGTLLKDLSGNENHGTLSGGMDYTAALTGAIVGQGLSFNGTGNLINMGTGQSLEVEKELTLVTLLKSRQNKLMGIFTKQSSGKLLDTGSACSEWSNYCGYLMAISTDIFFGRVYNTTGHPDRSCSTKKVAVKDNYFIVTYVIRDGELGKMYVNGELVTASNRGVTQKISKSKNPLLLGRYWNDTVTGAGYDYFDGILDEVRIYNRTLDDAEIFQQAKAAGF